MSQIAMTAADVREIVEPVGFGHAELCLERAESQGDANEARTELNRMFNDSDVDTYITRTAA